MNATLLTETIDQADVQKSQELAQTLSPELAGSTLLSTLVSSEKDQSPKGLILSVENIKNIKQYVDFGMGLCCDADQIQKNMDYPAAFDGEKYKNLSPAGLANFHRSIHDHCATWSSLEANIKEQGSNLEVYALNFVNTTDPILKIFAELPILKKALTQMQDLPNADLSQLPVTQEDADLLRAISQLLDQLKSETDSELAKTQEVSKQLETFRSTLDNDLTSQLANMEAEVEILSRNFHQSELLQKKTDLTKEIQNLDSQYKKLVGYAFTGASGMVFPPLGIITWAITGGIYGDKAEKVRKQRNQRQDELTQVVDELARQDALAALVSRTSNHLHNSSIVLYDALSGIKNLESLWKCMQTFVANAQTMLASSQTAPSLLTLESLMKSAHDSWNKVHDMAASLIRTFQEAEAQLK